MVAPLDIQNRIQRVLVAAFGAAMKAQPPLSLNHPEWSQPIETPLASPEKIRRVAEAIALMRDKWCPPSLKASADAAHLFMVQAAQPLDPRRPPNLAMGEAGLRFLEWITGHLDSMRGHDKPRIAPSMFLVVEDRDGSTIPTTERNGIAYLLVNPVRFEGAVRSPHFRRCRLVAIEGAEALEALLTKLRTDGVATIATGWEYGEADKADAESTGANVQVQTVAAPIEDLLEALAAWKREHGRA